MSRTHRNLPAWTWRCDECRAEYGLAREQSGLPSKDEMRAIGWYIAPLYGDLCPDCLKGGQE